MLNSFVLLKVLDCNHKRSANTPPPPFLFAKIFFLANNFNQFMLKSGEEIQCICFNLSKQKEMSVKSSLKYPLKSEKFPK